MGVSEADLEDGEGARAPPFGAPNRFLKICKGPSINYVRIFSRFSDPPPPMLHTVRI